MPNDQADFVSQLPEEMQTHPSAVKFKGKGAADIFQSYTELEKAFSRSDRVVVPKEGSKPEEIAAFHRALGVPEKVDDYKVEPVEGVAFDENRIKHFLPAAHALGLTQQQVNGLLKNEIDWQKKATEAQQKEAAAYEAEWIKAYPREEDRKAAMEQGKRVLVRLAAKQPELAKALEGFLGKDLMFTQGMAALASEFSEGAGLSSEEIETRVQTLDEQINTLMASKEYKEGKRDAIDRMVALTEANLKLKGKIGYNK